MTLLLGRPAWPDFEESTRPDFKEWFLFLSSMSSFAAHVVCIPIQTKISSGKLSSILTWLMGHLTCIPI